ncbi:hypothetical protein M407DRAFT_145490 [Tulasnella calospora MUT 4182]|uniref:Uncharacterized protein n=1 Tax=Tulasnella calospora MUT 4182 TaxID=1051891 RepID=A0A0C3Q6X8_9AGAM|nr:hypothetical protein M407DRAFT_145490 [Tulasnella calospora MUT 4182]
MEIRTEYFNISSVISRCLSVLESVVGVDERQQNSDQIKTNESIKENAVMKAPTSPYYQLPSLQPIIAPHWWGN